MRSSRHEDEKRKQEGFGPKQILSVECLMILTVKRKVCIRSVSFEIKSVSTAPVNHYIACRDFGLLFMGFGLFIDLL